MDARDRELIALSTAKNNLETFIYDMRDKLENDLRYKKASTLEEQIKINDKLKEIDTWLFDEGINADIKLLKSKLDELKILTKYLKLRVEEVDLRLNKINELNEALNITENFLETSHNVFLEMGKDEEKPFTDEELKHLEKVIKNTYVSSYN